MLHPSSKKSSKLMLAKKAAIITIDPSAASTTSATNVVNTVDQTANHKKFTFDTNPSNPVVARNYSTQYSSDRVVRLNNHYEKSSAKTTVMPVHQQKSSSMIKTKNDHNHNNNHQKSTEFKKNIFSILSNKPKFQTRRYELNNTPTPPPLTLISPSQQLTLSPPLTNPDHSSQSLQISVRDNTTMSSTTTDSCESSSDLSNRNANLRRATMNCSGSNESSGSRSGGEMPSVSPLNRSISCDFGNSSAVLESQLYFTSIPVIDYTNQDYVITRL